MNYPKFVKAIKKITRKNPSYFTSIEDVGVDGDEMHAMLITADSYAKQGQKWFKDNTSGELQAKIALAVSFRGTIKCKIYTDDSVRFDIKEGKNSYTFSSS